MPDLEAVAGFRQAQVEASRCKVERRSRRYVEPPQNFWYRPTMRDHRHRCCDCGLVEIMEFRVVKGRVEIRGRRDERATAASRAALTRKKQKGGTVKKKVSFLAVALAVTMAGFAAAQEIEVLAGDATLQRGERGMILALDRDYDGVADAVFELETEAGYEAAGPAEVEFWGDGLSAYFFDAQTVVVFGVENVNRPELRTPRPHSSWEDVSFERVELRRFRGTALLGHRGGGVSTMGERRPTPQPVPPGPGQGSCGWSCSIGCARGSCTASCSSGLCAVCECDLAGNPACSCWPPR